MQIGFGILLEKEHFNYARRLELELRQWFGSNEGLKQPPHITFKAPFTVNSMEPFANYLDELAATTHPFDVTVEGFGAFPPHVLYLDVEPNQELFALHTRVLEELDSAYQVPPGRFEGQQVKFHSTVAIGDPTENAFASAKAWLGENSPRFSFTIKTFGLFYHLEPDGGWIICHQSAPIRMHSEKSGPDA